jgi:hypothetical protein
MKYFRYKLYNFTGPDILLPVDAAAGYSNGDWIYGKADIPSLDILISYQAEEITEEIFNSIIIPVTGSL